MQVCLQELTGMSSISLQPAGGAQGELTGILMYTETRNKHEIGMTEIQNGGFPVFVIRTL